MMEEAQELKRVRLSVERVDEPYMDVRVVSEDTLLRMDITVNHHGKIETFTLNFKPTESLLLKVDAEGIQQIDLGFMPKKMNGYQENN